MSATTITTTARSSTSTQHITTSAATTPRGDVEAPLKFYNAPSDPEETPYMVVMDPPQIRNYSDIDHKVLIRDARNHESSFSLSNHAFALLKDTSSTSSAVNWKDDESIREHYYPTVTALLQSALHTSDIILFDHTIRYASPTARRAPVNRVHVDQTPKSAADRVRLHSSSPKDAEARLAGRYRIINVWRSIAGPVESYPLAFAEADSLSPEDIVAIEHRYPDRTGETAGIKHGDPQKWWYWSGADEDERILLQCFDSEALEKKVPHSAFVDPRNDEDAKPRESIEVRALVFG
jgi:hypothetical protein